MVLVQICSHGVETGITITDWWKLEDRAMTWCGLINCKGDGLFLTPYSESYAKMQVFQRNLELTREEGREEGIEICLQKGMQKGREEGRPRAKSGDSLA